MSNQNDNKPVPFSPPCEDGACEGLIGVIFGNGPSIDEIPNSVFDEIKKPKYVTVGVNKAGVLQRFREVDFKPDILLLWDPPSSQPAVKERTQRSIQYLESDENGRPTHTVSIQHPGLAGHRTRQTFSPQNKFQNTLKEGVSSLGSVADGAANLLYCMGVRTIYLYGVDFYGHYSRIWDDGSNQIEFPHSVWGLESRQTGINSAETWRQVIESMPGLSVFCGNKRSLIVRRGVVPFERIKTDAERENKKIDLAAQNEQKERDKKAYAIQAAKEEQKRKERAKKLKASQEEKIQKREEEKKKKQEIAAAKKKAKEEKLARKNARKNKLN